MTDAASRDPHLAIMMLQELWLSGASAEHLALAEDCVRRWPTAEFHIHAAYGHDRSGDSRAAIRHYDAAWNLGIPEGEQRRFIVGYGSTLRNVGRPDEAVTVLAEAANYDPDYPPFSAFLALALFSAGRPRAALATMLSVALDTRGADVFDGYDQALHWYHDELLRAEIERSH